MPEQQHPEEFSDSRRSSSASSFSSSISNDLPNLIIEHQVVSANNNNNSVSLALNSVSSRNDEDFVRRVFGDRVNINRSPEETKEVLYEPIKLPSEPTLEELLKQLTGNGDLDQVRQIKLRVISSAISLQRLPYFLTRLRCLNLEGSLLFSLRDLGCDLSSLVYLNVSRCGLKSLDGTNGLSTLFELVADGNEIDDAGPCSNIPCIKKISLSNNRIKDFSGMMFLGLCQNLKYLDLSNNAITRKLDYRERVKSNVPNLVFLDNVPYGEVSDQLISDILASEYKPGESEVNRNVQRMNAYNQQLNIENIPQRITLNVVPNIQRSVRPGTASSETRVVARVTDVGSRPSTADGTRFKHDVTIGEPVCGSIVTKARKLRKLRTAWGESTSCSSLSSSDSSCANNKSFKEEEEPSGSHTEESSENLLEESRQWRIRNQENQKRYNQ